MLRVVQVNSPQSKKEFLNNFDVFKDSWIVSDLQSREEVQLSLRRRQGYIEGLSVLRASELWTELLKRGFPEFRLAGRHLSRMVLSEFLHEHQQFSSSRATSTLMNYISQLMPLLSHPEGRAMMLDWFEGHPESSMRWRTWFELSHYGWRYFQSQKLLSKSWASAFLANHWNQKCHWDRKCFFDLGLEIHQVEAELIRHLSTSSEVTVFEPIKPKHLEADYSDRVYDMIRGFATEVIKAEPLSQDRQKHSFHRLATPLAEVKEAVSQARVLADNGVSAYEIAIVAPKLENYWFCLRSYLEKEGLPIRRSSSERYSSLLSIQQWLADLRVRVGELSSSDLELSFFAKKQPPKMKYEIFKSLFSSIYEESHFSRDDEVVEHFSHPYKEQDSLERDEFVSFAIRYWPSHADFSQARSLLQVLVQECGIERSFKQEQWVEYLSALAAEQELRTSTADRGGVYCGDIRSVEHIEAKHIFYLGLTSSEISQNGGQQVLAGDVEAIASDIGFFLNHPEQDHIEGLIRWMSQCSPAEQHYLFPLTDFQGTEMSPAKFWIKAALGSQQDVEKVSSPQKTRWDELRARGPEDQVVQDSIQFDLGEKQRPHFASELNLALSASSVESYLRCPFIFGAQKIFRLADEPIADVDFEARGKGQIIHALFEHLLEPPVNFSRSDEGLRELLDKIAEEQGLTKIEKKFWPSLRERLVILGKRFLEKEQVRKSQFPSTSTVGRELDFKFYFQPETKAISLAPEAGAVEFRGQIDRLDTDEKGAAVLYDYKSSKTSKMSHANRWLETKQVQLSLYIIAVEEEATKAGRHDVIAAFYYIIKDLGDYHGFRIPEEAGRLYDLSDKRRNRISKAEKESILEGVKDLLAETILEMRKGNFLPKPADVKICETCPWSRTCRAPHLH